LHLGGEDSLSHLSGIHGVHLNHMEYIATSRDRSTIPWVQRRNADGSETVFTASALNGAQPQGERRTMDCIDCHNRASHTFQTPEEALNRAMADGAVSPELPWIHKEGLELLKANYSSQNEARVKIPQQLKAFYSAQRPDVLQQKAGLVKAAADQLVTIYTRNVFPDMKVTWGTHPNNIGHTAYPGCFRCHDGDHTSKGGKTITQDCANCHNLLAVEESKPKVLADLGL
jgi:NAD-dependent SIR2 family protein deacetylase